MFQRCDAALRRMDLVLLGCAFQFSHNALFHSASQTSAFFFFTRHATGCRARRAACDVIRSWRPRARSPLLARAKKGGGEGLLPGQRCTPAAVFGAARRSRSVFATCLSSIKLKRRSRRLHKREIIRAATGGSPSYRA